MRLYEPKKQQNRDFFKKGFEVQVKLIASWDLKNYIKKGIWNSRKLIVSLRLDKLHYSFSKTLKILL